VTAVTRGALRDSAVSLLSPTQDLSPPAATNSRNAYIVGNRIACRERNDLLNPVVEKTSLPTTSADALGGAGCYGQH
jgi:hypothetical protein